LPIQGHGEVLGYIAWMDGQSWTAPTIRETSLFVLGHDHTGEFADGVSFLFYSVLFLCYAPRCGPIQLFPRWCFTCTSRVLMLLYGYSRSKVVVLSSVQDGKRRTIGMLQEPWEEEDEGGDIQGVRC
jgi:hypothetical protein